MMSSSTNKRYILSLYGQLLRYNRLIKNTIERENNLIKIKLSFQQDKLLTNSQQIKEAIKRAENQLSLYKITLPKLRSKNSEQKASTRLFFDKNGQVIDFKQVDQRMSRKYAFHTLDPDDIKRHHALNERFHFGGEYWKNKR